MSSSGATEQEPVAPEVLSRERLLAYLLGELPASELAEIDGRLLVDRDFHAAVRKARNDLRTDYRRGALSPVERERARRALNLRSAAREEPAGTRRPERAGRAATARPAPASGHRGSRRAQAWGASLGAAVVCGLGIWLAVRGTFSGAPASSGARPYLPTNSGLVMTAAPVATFVLLLRPGANDGQATTRTVQLPKGQQTLETQIVVPRAVARYDVRVRSASGPFDYRDLVPRTVSGVSYVELMIPHERLSAGTYQFALMQAGPGTPQLIRRYTVQVITQ